MDVAALGGRAAEPRYRYVSMRLGRDSERSGDETVQQRRSNALLTHESFDSNTSNDVYYPESLPTDDEDSSCDDGPYRGIADGDVGRRPLRTSRNLQRGQRDKMPLSPAQYMPVAASDNVLASNMSINGTL